MKSLCYLCLLLLVIIVVNEQVNSNDDSNVCNGITLAPDKQIFHIEKNKFKTNIKLKNTCEQSIYIATDPRRENGSKDPYFILNRFNNSILEISIQVHPKIWTGYKYSDNRGVILKKLASGEEYRYSLDLEFPIRETEPPYHGEPLKENKVTPKMINQIDIKIGYFFEDEGIKKFLNLKHFGWFINGGEKITVGKNANKSFLEVQNLASTSIYKITQE